MTQRTKDVIVIPTLIAVVTGVLFMFWGAWYSGVKWHSPFSLVWLRAVFTVPVPLWFTLPILAVSFGVAWKGLAAIRERSNLLRANAELLAQRKAEEHERRLASYWKAQAERFEEIVGQMKAPEPVLHASWRGDSAWGWASTGFVEDPFRVFVVRGTVTFLMDNISEPLAITGVEIDGLRAMGAFETFMLCPAQTEQRNMTLHFQGEGPPGNDYNTLILVFRDIRGKRYPTEPHRFSPLPIPERVQAERLMGMPKRKR